MKKEPKFEDFEIDNCDTGGSISPNLKAIFVIILCINWTHHRVEWPKLYQILKKIGPKNNFYQSKSG